ncbi:MAG: tRNA threonylcarbamoyladenosine dehydratase [Eggerthellaceae bacterium]|jgi:tRNA A37 threonylcarbamoyladenosine dehydratase
MPDSDRFTRTRLLLGSAALDRLANARVAVFGIGGVGGYATEALARSGIGALDLVDSDTIDITNVNRQIVAASSTLGQYKADIMARRVRDINPHCTVTVHRCFYLPGTAGQFDFRDYDYVVDAVDTVTAKLQLIMQAKECGTPIISSMGAGNKLDPARFEVADIYETSVCPLAKTIRKELRKRGVDSLKVVYSTEPPIPANALHVDCAAGEGAADANNAPSVSSSAGTADTPPSDHGRRSIPGSVAFVPPVVGMIMAGEVVRDLAAQSEEAAG